MEKLQLGPIHPCLLEEYLEQENGGLGSISCGGQFINRFEDPHCSLPSLEDKMPFLQMLQGFEPYPQLPLSPPLMAADTAATFPFLQEPSFQLLLKLQQEKMNMNFFAAGELESCVTTNNNDMIMELHSPIKSEITYKDQTQIPTPPLTQTLSPTNQRENQRKKGARSKRMTQLLKSSVDGGAGGGDAAAAVSAAPKERRKRKRAARPSKNKEQVESQRMTHIAVERNRRRQMNEHLNALRSLMPPSYVQRGDQASIIGGAIDFVKELEQLLQSLQAQKRMKQCEDQNGDVSATSTSTSSSSNFFSNMFMASSSSSPSSSLQFRNAHNFHEEGNHHEEICAENRSSLGNIEVVVIQNHVNLKVQCERRPGQLLKAIVALEDLRLSVLHLNITSLHSLVLYSFNLKIEDDCKLGSADEVASAVHQIFSLINIS